MTANRVPPSTGPGNIFANRVAEEIVALALCSSCPLTGVAGTNVITATSSYSLDANASGQKFTFMPAASNTGAVTLNVDGKGALTLRSRSGAVLPAGRLQPGVIEHVINAGGEYRLLTEAPAAAQTLKRAVFALQKSSGVDGGTVVNATRTRYPFNTVVLNDIPGLSLDTTTQVGRITVPAGSYSRIECHASFYGVPSAAVFLRNITTGADISSGIVRRSASSADNATLSGAATFATSTQIEVQYFATGSQAGNGLGFAVGDSQPEQYGFIEFQTFG